MPSSGALYAELAKCGFVRTNGYTKKVCRAKRKSDSAIVVLTVIVSYKVNGYCSVRCVEGLDNEVFWDSAFTPTAERIFDIINSFLRKRYSELI